MTKSFKTILLAILAVFVVAQSGLMVYLIMKVDKLATAVTAAPVVANNAASDTGDSANDASQYKDVSPVPVEIEGSPSTGPENAPIVFVEFTDFECPFCKEVQPTVKELMKKYDGKIRHVFRHYPLSAIHKGAVPAASASMCANDQGKFWEYHDKLFEKANNGGSLTNDVLKATADELGLDRTAFDSCFSSKKYLNKVQQDFEAGNTYQVSGTPTFFINNRVVSGNLPLEVFEGIIEEELNKKKL